MKKWLTVYTTDLPPIQKGLGRIGELKEPMTLKDFTQFVKTKLDVNGARFVGDQEAVVKK